MFSKVNSESYLQLENIIAISQYVTDFPELMFLTVLYKM